MGVPAFFRWLTRKYPSVIVDCIEETAEQGKNVDSSEKNPNGEEFDNLYLDMNGIIHPCTHPENKPAPTNEDEMMIAIFECIDRLFNIVRPRKVLYLAIDGVAPRAKMNQQRSRRFRAAKETAEKKEQIAKIRAEMEAKGYTLPPEKDKSSHFDSNCITPGTEFMARLTECLNYYIHDRIANDPGWKKIKVILSDASVPGEGEHKIMDFIRKQRGHPDHDPNTKHCLCGADADLIMLGLATHEPYFTIIREEFIINQTKRCDICGQSGHELTECKGLSSDMDMTQNVNYGAPTRYIFVRLNVIREYLEQELKMPELPFPYDFERALDDWVFMCFFVGNDFLPHLPSLEIREGAIDKLVTLYKKCVYRTGGFITNSGDVNLDRVQLIMRDLGALEDEIFRKRQRNEQMFKMRNRQRKLQELREKMRDNPGSTEDFELKEEEEPPDEVRLFEQGYKERYYRLKFNIENCDEQQRHKIGHEYVLGLCWVLKYYYQGCASWKWYFPYHYAPFASDFVSITRVNQNFEKGTRPLTPLEQLMGVFPAGSSTFVPPTWAKLMTDPFSTILDFYPKDFMIDLNGKRFAWQGVALLPFVDENRLRKGLAGVYKDLTEAEIKRNTLGHDRLYVGLDADCFSFINNLDVEVYQKERKSISSSGMKGEIYIVPDEMFQGEEIVSPVKGLNNVSMNSVICVAFCDPPYAEDYTFKAVRLPGVEEPPRVLQNRDDQGSSSGRPPSLFNDTSSFRYPTGNRNPRHPRPQIGLVPSTTQAFLGDAGHRALQHSLPSSHSYIPLGGRGRGGHQLNNSFVMRREHDGNRNHPYRSNYGGQSRWQSSAPPQQGHQRSFQQNQNQRDQPSWNTGRGRGGRGFNRQNNSQYSNYR